EFFGEVDGFPAIASLADDLHVFLIFEDHAEALTDQGMIVCEQDADHDVLRGAQTSMVRPSPGLDSSFNSPPALRARARMPESPMPLRAFSESPRPLSESVSMTWPSSARRLTEARVAPEWRAMLVRAS